MIPLRYACPLAALLAICLLLDLVAAAPLPGVAWSKLEIWEGSAAADVLLYASDLRDDANTVGEFNVLEFFSDLDTRFFPITDDDRERE